MGLLEEIRQARRDDRCDVDSWEYAETWYWSDFDVEPDQDSLRAAHSKWDTSPAEAFASYLELSDRGSLLALYWLGVCCEYGHGVALDLQRADEYYFKAIEGGCWLAALQRAHAFARQDRWDDCFEVLEDGVSKNVYPFYFWLAWYLHERGTDRAGYQRIDRLLARADKAGHPQALAYRSKFRAKGKLGWRRIPSGFKLLKRLLDRQMAAGTDDDK